MRKILQLGNEILEKETLSVNDLKSPKVKEIIKDMMEVLNSIGDKSAGLSAPQIGENLRIAICRRVDIEKEGENLIWEVMINPEIIEKSRESSTYWEGCLSIAEGNIFGEVERSKKVKVKYQDSNGNLKHLEADDFFSHVVQHELDHLDGILFLKYVKDPANLKRAEEFEKDE